MSRQTVKTVASGIVNLAAKVLVGYIFWLGLEEFHERHADFPYLNPFAFLFLLLGLFAVLVGYYFVRPFVEGVREGLKRRNAGD